MNEIDDNEFDSSNTDAKEQYLLFLAGGELYGIEALKAQEIVEYAGVTKIPMVNSYIKGVTNIRGNIVPVIDLINRFKLGRTKVSDKTSIVVVNYMLNDEPTQIGIMIDKVYEVVTIPEAHIKQAPEFGSKIASRFILNMGKYDQAYIPILNTDVILNTQELSTLVTQ